MCCCCCLVLLSHGSVWSAATRAFLLCMWALSVTVTWEMQRRSRLEIESGDVWVLSQSKRSTTSPIKTVYYVPPVVMSMSPRRGRNRRAMRFHPAAARRSARRLFRFLATFGAGGASLLASRDHVRLYAGAGVQPDAPTAPKNTLYLRRLSRLRHRDRLAASAPAYAARASTRESYFW